MPKNTIVVKDSNRGYESSSVVIFGVDCDAETFLSLWEKFEAFSVEVQASWATMLSSCPEAASRQFCLFLGYVSDNDIAYELINDGSGKYEGAADFECGYIMGKFIAPYPLEVPA